MESRWFELLVLILLQGLRAADLLVADMAWSEVLGHDRPDRCPDGLSYWASGLGGGILGELERLIAAMPLVNVIRYLTGVRGC